MMKSSLILVSLIGAVVPVAISAGEPIAATPAITVVPFAVPVAVPVAVVQSPTLFYGVSGYAVPGGASTATPVLKPVESVNARDESVQLREQATAILKRHCSECHQGTQAQGGVTLFDDAGRLESLLPRQLIVDATELTVERTPPMPPAGREPLSRDEWRVLKQWARMPKSFVY